MKVSVKESCIVRPAQDTPKHSIWISNLDLLQARLHVGLIHCYELDGSSNFFDTELLKETLSRTLVPFYPVAGRLRRDHNGRPEIYCNADGVLFVVAETDSVMGGFAGVTRNPEFRHCVPTVDYSTDISSYPLLLVQVTFFKCGGVCLSIGWHLLLSDGHALINFTRSWAQLARGLPINITPFFDRTLLRARFPPSITFHHPEFDPPPTMNSPNQTQEFQSCPKLVILKLTLDQLKVLKASVNGTKTTANYTTHEVLVAHIWRCVSRARCLADDQATRLHVTLNGRFKLVPPLPQNYFGSAIFPVRPIALAGDLRREPLEDTAERIHRATKKMNDGYLRSAIDYLEKHPDIECLVPRKGNEIYRCPNLSIVSWSRLPFHDFDFGWGKAVYAGPASIYSEGKGYISASPASDGGLLLAICLEINHVPLFKKLLYEVMPVSAM